MRFDSFIFTDEDSTPPPSKKQRKSSSSDNDFYEHQRSSKADCTSEDIKMDSNSEEMNSVNPGNSSTSQPQNSNQDNSDTNEASAKGIIPFFFCSCVKNEQFFY